MFDLLHLISPICKYLIAFFYIFLFLTKLYKYFHNITFTLPNPDQRRLVIFPLPGTAAGTNGA